MAIFRFWNIDMANAVIETCRLYIMNVLDKTAPLQYGQLLRLYFFFQVTALTYLGVVCDILSGI